VSGKYILEKEDVIKLADPITNFIVLDGSMVENRYPKIYDELEFLSFDWRFR